MTSNARDVLEDCKVAADELLDGIAGRGWRIRWVTAVALLRAVGHVLQKVDASTNPLLKSVIDEAWDRLSKTKPEPAIFWQFIEDERNSILKEYHLSAGLSITVRPGTGHLNLTTGEQWGEPGLPTLYDYQMKSGPYAGIDQREVLQQAIRWWDSYLGEIERTYASRKP
ncbi:MAG: hypothetical protein ACYCY1_03740 [Sulfuriferula sp.]